MDQIEKLIQEEEQMNERVDIKNLFDEYENKINKVKLSKEARNKAISELKKLKSMSPMSAESTVVRNYLDVLLGLPSFLPSFLQQVRINNR